MEITIQLSGNNKKGKGNHGKQLSASEKKLLTAFVKKAGSKVAAAIEIGIDRNVLDRVLLTGAANEENIAKIKEALHDNY